MKIKIIMLVLILLLVQTATALNVSRIAPQEIQAGEILEVQIVINNDEDIDKTLRIEEQVSAAEPVDPENVTTFRWEGARASFYIWEINISRNTKEIIRYKIRPFPIGTYTLSPTNVIDEQNNLVRALPTTIEVRCIPNYECEFGENIINCPEDCKTGSQDNICDFAADGVCDPDCEIEADPDCEPEIEEPSNVFRDIIMILLFIVILFSIVLILKKKKSKSRKKKK
jgi:hypothetical protein